MNLGGTIRLNKFGIFIVLCIIFIFGLHVFTKNSEATSETKKINLSTLLNVAIKAAENGGKRVVESKENMNVQSKGLTKEGMQESVTNADILSHCDMTKTIKYFFPRVKLISEENVKNCDDKANVDYSLMNAVDINNNLINEEDVTIWIDPLDATHEYTEKLYMYVTTMVCVAVKGKPVMGVIHKPFEKTTSWVWVDKAKSKDLSNQEPENKSPNIKVIVSRSHKGDVEKILQNNFKQKVDIITAAGAGYKALEVAKKKVDAYIHTTAIKKWDLCAGNAVINALGGKMVNKDGAELDYSNDIDVTNKDGLIASLDKYDTFIGKLDI
ncbi:putative inositol monophosphatase 3 [Diabrotica virgifera virgifera]|uniref:inositol-phosphate phosphatase n=1 Tax=Diabrotica virgifera virgifera TaxID=50390 RepID=A0A6P7G9E8_DIAVI|nr:putative inositol monophosphatase 3 [Diabrotica virgifera virgifera]